MNSLVISAATISSLLLLFVCISVAEAGVLVDTDGDLVRNGGSYFILPNAPNAKPLTYTTLTRPTTIPFYITESGKFNLKPIAVTVSTPFRIAHIPSSLPISITFVGDSHPFCKDPLTWFLSADNANDFRALATVCGQNGERSRLFIDEDEAHQGTKNVYNLSFCINGCADRLKLGWVELGRPDNTYLGINPSKPLPVVFQKAIVPLINSVI